MAALTGHSKVEFAVTIEVTRDNAPWGAAGRNRCAHSEGSVSVAKQNRYRIAVFIGHGEVEFAVAVEIPGHNADRGLSGGR